MKRPWLASWNWATLAAWALVLATVWLVRGTIHDSQVQLRGKLHQEFTKRFDELSPQRQQLATALLPGKIPRKSYESVMNFFEDLGLYLRRNYLDEEMVWNTFGDHTAGRWAACEAQVKKG